MLPSAAELVARYLRANGYLETLKSFTQEADLPPEIGSNPSDSISIESILKEKTTFDSTLQFEKLGFDDQNSRWTSESPCKPKVLSSLPARSNVLNVSVMHLRLPSKQEAQQYLVVTTADRRLTLLDPTSPTSEVIRSYSNLQDSPILDVVALDPELLLLACMSGKLVLFNTSQDKVVSQRTDHAKYIVKLANWRNGNTRLIASAGWDAKIILYELEVGDNVGELGEPVAVLHLESIPETITFIESNEGGLPILLVARRDSTFLHYYTTPTPDSPVITLLGRQNLTPHSNAWVAFTPSDVQICPTDPSVVAIGTSSTPHMKLLVVRLLIPSQRSSLLHLGTDKPEETITQASHARAQLMVQDREESAILVNVSTLAPQTQYSTPRITWRPDGSGIYVSSDDGFVRGIEAKTGKIMILLEGHDKGSKLRCLWAGRLDNLPNGPAGSLSRERLISGGFDQKLILWEP